LKKLLPDSSGPLTNLTDKELYKELYSIKKEYEENDYSNEDELQNHRMLGVGRDLYGSSSPTPLPKQGHLQLAAQDRVQAGLEYLQRRRLHNLPGQPVSVLRHPQSEEVLPHVQTELPMLPFVPVAPCPVAGHHHKEFGPNLLTPTLKICIRSPGRQN